MTSCFSCTGCGKCCTGSPGYVFVSVTEIEAMATFLNLSIEDFSQKYIRIVHGRYSLKELLPHYDCVFFKEKMCSIYEARPTQCKTYPFWPTHLESETSWEAVKKECEGIDQASKLPLLNEPFSCHS